MLGGKAIKKQNSMQHLVALLYAALFTTIVTILKSARIRSSMVSSSIVVYRFFKIGDPERGLTRRAISRVNLMIRTYYFFDRLVRLSTFIMSFGGLITSMFSSLLPSAVFLQMAYLSLFALYYTVSEFVLPNVITFLSRAGKVVFAETLEEGDGGVGWWGGKFLRLHSSTPALPNTPTSTHFCSLLLYLIALIIRLLKISPTRT